jgi:hypothetical protein
LKINLANITINHLKQLEQVFSAYAGGQGLRSPVREFFDALAALCELEATRRIAAPGVKITGVEFVSLPDFTATELTVLKRMFMEWRDGFTKSTPAVAEFLNDLAILMDDHLLDVAQGNKDLNMLNKGITPGGGDEWTAEIDKN